MWYTSETGTFRTSYKIAQHYVVILCSVVLDLAWTLQLIQCWIVLDCVVLCSVGFGLDPAADPVLDLARIEFRSVASDALGSVSTSRDITLQHFLFCSAWVYLYMCNIVRSPYRTSTFKWTFTHNLSALLYSSPYRFFGQGWRPVWHCVIIQGCTTSWGYK